MNINDDTRLPLIARDTLVCSFAAIGFIFVWVLGNFVGGYEGFLPFFAKGVMTVLGFVGACLSTFWIFVPIDIRGNTFPSFYK